MSSNFNSDPAPGPHPSAAGLSLHEYELMLLATETVVGDARRAHDDAASEIEAWQIVLGNVA
jgi:hypothetical protein